MALRQKQLNASINNTGNTKVAEQQAPPLPPSKRTHTEMQLTSRKEIQSMIKVINLLRIKLR
jgi:hypothetical protein